MQYLTCTTYRKRGLTWLMVQKVQSMIGWLHGKWAWQRKAAYFKQKEKGEARRERCPSSAPSDTP